MTVLAAKHWGTNAAMFVDVARLWIPADAIVLDPTYGKGGFWKKVRPTGLIAHDLYTLDGVDFRHLPEADGSVDVVTYDPAYVVPGGRDTSTVPDFNQQYGMDSTEKTLGKQWEDVIVPGAFECARVLRPDGLLMWKAQNYISSSAYHNYRQAITAFMGEVLLFEQVDEFMFIRKSGGMQPKGRTRKCDGPHCNGTGFIGPREREDPCLRCNHTGRLPTQQQHSRNNASFLIIGRKK